MGAATRNVRVEPQENSLGIDWEGVATTAVGPTVVCCGCGRVPVDDVDRAAWRVFFAGLAHGETAKYLVGRVCSPPCFAAAIQQAAEAQERGQAERIARALAEQRQNDNRSASEDVPDLADDPVWQSGANAPPGPAETEEQRRWSEEAELEEREIVERCARG